MTEQALIIKALSDFLNGTKTFIPNDIDFEKLIETAREHRVETLLYFQAENIPQNVPDFKHNFQLQFAGATANYAKRTYFLKNAESAFNKAKIPFLIFKGIPIAELYPINQLRTMGDVDILVHPENKSEAGRILESLGLTLRDSGPNEWAYFDNSGLCYELHSRLMNDETANSPLHRTFLASVWENAHNENGNMRYSLDWNYHFVFFILHLRKHLINCGVGLRQFFDLAMVYKNCVLDFDVIFKDLEELGIYDFALKCFALCEKWFNIKMPRSAKISDDFFERATASVIAGGVFGFNNSENMDNAVILNINEHKNYKIKNFFASLFPSYKSIKDIPAYKSLNGRPLLLPLFWLYRFYYCIRHHKVKSGISGAVKPFNISNTTAKVRLEELKHWGL